MKNKKIYQITSLVMVLIMILGDTIHTQAQTTGPTIYWGALVDGKAPSTTNLQGVMATFETRSKKKMSIIHWGQPWMMSDGSWGEFQTSYFTNVRNHGSIPMINWASWKLGGGINQSSFQLRDVYNGNYDTYIRRWATAAKNWGHPFFLRFNHEMNGWWYPWGEGKTSSGVIVNGNSSGDYIKAWRHVHNIFVSVGATNVTWVWAPNHMSTSSQYPSLSSIYPGDSYVNWTGFSVYNKYTTWAGLNPLLTGSSGMTWFSNSYSKMVTLAPTKPMMLAEFATIEAGDGGTKKAAWIKDALTTQIPTNFPKIKAIVYMEWDINAGKTYPIESSTASANAWAAGITLARYASNKYANLNTSPIPALSGSSTTASAALNDSPIESETALPTSPPASSTPTVASTPIASPTDVPVTPTVSPTVVLATSDASPTETSMSLIATADTYSDEANPDTTAGGTNTTLYINSSPAQTTLLKFDLSPLAGKTALMVNLRFKTTADASAGSGGSANVKLIDDVLWKEQYPSYNNTVSISETMLGTLPANSAPDTWYEVPLVPSAIQAKFGGLLSVAIEATGSDELLLYSREATDQPQLVIIYK
jgi:beta-mannanase